MYGFLVKHLSSEVKANSKDFIRQIVRNLLLSFHGIVKALKPVQVPLNGICSLQHFDCTTQIGIISKLAVCFWSYCLCHLKRYWTVPVLVLTPEDTSCLRLDNEHCNPFECDHSTNSLSTEWPFRKIHVQRCCARQCPILCVQVNDISFFSHVYHCCNSILEGHQASRAWFVISAAMLAYLSIFDVPSHSFQKDLLHTFAGP